MSEKTLESQRSSSQNKNSANNLKSETHQDTIDTPIDTPHCKNCGSTTYLYDGLVPIKGFKWYVWVLAIIFIILVWIYAIWYSFQQPALNSWIIMVGVVISPICLTLAGFLVLRFMHSPQKGKMAICNSCGDVVALSNPPIYAKSWNLDKFKKIIASMKK